MRNLANRLEIARARHRVRLSNARRAEIIERNPFRAFVENELNMDVLDELAAEHARRRREVINELRRCLEEVEDLLGGYSPYGRIPPTDSRD